MGYRIELVFHDQGEPTSLAHVLNIGFWHHSGYEQGRELQFPAHLELYDELFLRDVSQAVLYLVP